MARRGCFHLCGAARRKLHCGLSLCFGESRRSLVVLCGWLGAKTSHLEKYAALAASTPMQQHVAGAPSESVAFELGGTRVMQFIAPTLMLLKSEKFVERFFSDIADRVIRRASVLSAAAGGDPEPLVVYAFSGNGALSAGLLLQALRVRMQERPRYRQGKTPLVLTGIAFDSGPCHINEQVMARGYFGAATSLLLKRAIYNHAVITPVLEKIFSGVLRLWTQRRELLEEVLQELLDLDLHRPLQLKAKDGATAPLHQLVLVSQGDELVLLEDVRAFMERQRCLTEDRRASQPSACNTEFVEFGPGSEHVRHFVHKPQEYTAALHAFLRKTHLLEYV